ncbi:PhoX family protein [Brachybacterium aquaticum]|uniref:Secreted PhoX family phosphatase n=1 Tax=Brachybacterium aquaticum TaxID=1432564 RepID=A0A841AEA3_9MICO|nr:PhoX family phosphatase [Brachybacterium aquaticum]MBB5832283.1 secreted PhoX family phosphatase [Brachybacterium aquaticum]
MFTRHLPMVGHTKGNRSAVTCALKCGNACAHPDPNCSSNPTFKDIVDAAISRRSALGLGGVAAAVVVGGTAVAGAPAARADHGNTPNWGGTLNFDAIAPVPKTVDDVTVPEGYEWTPIIRWGDPLFADSSEFDLEHQTRASQEGQFGYNSDYLNVISDGGNDRTGYLVNNHEYTNENIMFSPEYIASNPEDVVDAGIAAHGLSVVDLERDGKGQPWRYVRGGRRNRRITGFTPFSVDGPAAGSDLLKTVEDPTGKLVLGTLNNCAGGTTPWGTVLSGEENFDQYFVGTAGNAEQERLGISPGVTQRGWERYHDRFNLNNAGYENEANRFGWIVEIDPEDPTSTPVKHTALGRFKHEAGTVHIAKSGHAVVYSGDDQRNDYVYKFVSAKKYRKGDKKNNMQLLSQGTLYVARFDGNSPASEIDGKATVPSDGAFDGTGEWIALVDGNESLVPGFTVEEVLVNTRLAADTMGATKMDRPEDVETNPVTGKVYIALTNNSQRAAGAIDEANPVPGNRDGHVIELIEDGNDHTSETFTWNILLLAGDPATSTTAYFSGFPADQVSPISCPDNLAFDSEGTLWISTDGQPGTLQYGDALHKVTLEGPERGRVQQFLAVPRDAETCGPVIHDRDNSVFVAVQHPGENGKWGAPTSYFPDFVPGGPLRGDKVAAPRPTVVQVWGGKPGNGNSGNNGNGNNGNGNSGNNGKGKGKNK